MLDAWVTRGFIRCYRVGDEWFGDIPSFCRHQVINSRERESEIPGIDEADQILTDACGTRAARVEHARPTPTQGKGKEGKGKEGKGKEGECARANTRTSPPEDPPPHPKGATARGTRLPDDCTLSDQWLEDAADQALSAVDAEREFAKFCDYWRAQAGQRGRKADWQATWRNWCRRAADDRSRGAGRRKGGDQVDDWVAERRARSRVVGEG